jgi:hypothetical protein
MTVYYVIAVIATQRYILLNQEGVKKILKKYSKILGVNLQDRLSK